MECSKWFYKTAPKVRDHRLNTHKKNSICYAGKKKKRIKETCNKMVWIPYTEFQSQTLPVSQAPSFQPLVSAFHFLFSTCFSLFTSPPSQHSSPRLPLISQAPKSSFTPPATSSFPPSLSLIPHAFPHPPSSPSLVSQPHKERPQRRF